MKTRVGKIARLPEPIREQLNQKLFDGVLGKKIISQEEADLGKKQVSTTEAELRGGGRLPAWGPRGWPTTFS